MARREIGTFDVWDYLVFGVILSVSAIIGVYYGCTGGKQRTTGEFLMANRRMSILPVSMSLLATFMSAIMLLGTPAEIYSYGTQYCVIFIAYGLMVPVSANIFLPVFYNLRLTSVFEYLELRFSRPLRTCAALIYVLQMTLYMAIVLYAPSLALNAVTGLNVWISVCSVGLVCTFYTTLGGMKAVMWTDVFQMTMMFIGILAVLIKGSIDQGGFSNIWSINEKGGRIEFLNFDPDPTVRHTVWTLTLGGTFTWLAIFGGNQAIMQRAMCTSSLKQGQIAIYLNFPGLTMLMVLTSLCGMVIYAQYKDCDPIANEDITAMDQLIPLYVMDRLSHVPGVPGLYGGCILSATLSTISSGLNSLAAVSITDLVKGVCFNHIPELRATRISKFFAFMYGVLCIGLAFLAANLGGVLQAALGTFGMISGPLVGLYVLGMIYPHANNKGAWSGLIAGLAITIWIGTGALIYKPGSPKLPISTARCPSDNITLADNVTLSMTTELYNVTTVLPQVQEVTGLMRLYKISYLWLSAIGCAVVSVVGLIVSFITGATDPDDVDDTLLTPFVLKLRDYFRRRKSVSPTKTTKNDVELVSQKRTSGHDNFVA